MLIALTSGALGMAVLGGCGGDDGVSEAAPVASVEDTLTAPAGSPTSTVDEEHPSPTTSAKSTRPRITPRRTAAAPSRAPKPTPSLFPPAVTSPEQGKDYWAAVVAVSENIEDPDFEPVKASLQEAGYPAIASGEDLGCYQGAAEFLKVSADPGTMFAIIELFATQAQAQQFERAYGGDLAGIGKVKAYCLDGLD